MIRNKTPCSLLRTPQSPHQLIVALSVSPSLVLSQKAWLPGWLLCLPRSLFLVPVHEPDFATSTSTSAAADAGVGPIAHACNTDSRRYSMGDYVTHRSRGTNEYETIGMLCERPI